MLSDTEKLGFLDNIYDIKEFKSSIVQLCNKNRSRRSGGGRKKATDKYPHLESAIKDIVEEYCYGDPMTTKKWTTCTLQLANDILEYDFNTKISLPTIAKIIDQLGYSRQKNKKMIQCCKPHPDRDTQFNFIKMLTATFL